MKIKELILFCFIALISISCSKETSDISALNLEGEFIINADQIITSSGPKFSYSITTVNEQICKSSDIIYTLIDVEGLQNLIIQDISQIDNCTTGEGIVSQNIPLSIDNTTTEIGISLRSVVKNKGTINKTIDRYILDIPNPEGILIGRKEVNELPDDVMFGWFTAQSVEALESTEAIDFLDSLQTFSTSILQDGYFTSELSVEDGKAHIEDGNVLEVHRDVYYRISDKEAFKNYIANYLEIHSNLGLRLRDAATGELLFL